MDTLRGVRDVFLAAATSPLPRGMPTAEFAEAQRYVAWPPGVGRDRLEPLAAMRVAAIVSKIM